MLPVILIISSFIYAHSQSSKELSLNTPITGSIVHSLSEYVNSSSSDFYKFYIQSNDSYTELLVTVLPLNKQSDPDLYISQSNEYPSFYSQSNMSCFASGLDLCAINLKDFTVDAWIYIGVVCYTDCSYTIRIDPSYVNETLNLGDSNILHFFETSSKIMKIFIPAIPNDSHILLTAIPLNSEQLNDTFHIFIKQGDLIPSTSDYDYYSYQLWHHGKGFSISGLSPSMKFIYNINYTVLIEAVQNALVLVNASIFENNKEIFIDSSIRDIIEYNEIHYYILKLNESLLLQMYNNSLKFRLNVFSGDADIYIHYDSKPQELSQYKWNSMESGSEGIVITHSNLENFNASELIYYIAIIGKIAGAYEIEVLSNAEEINQITFGETMGGEIINGEQVNYMFSIKGEHSLNVIIETITKSGNIKVYIGLCCEKKSCKIHKADAFMFYENKDMVKRLKFRHNSTEECAHESDICYYAILIEGANQTIQKSSKYTLSLNKDFNLNELHPNTAIRNHLNEEEKAFFQFYLSNVTDIKSLSFQINIVSGDAHIFYSKNTTFPNPNDYDAEIEYRDFVDLTFQKTDLYSGMYYFTIEAQTLLDYIFFVLMEKEGENGNKTQNYIQLYEGQPLKIKFHDINSQFLYEIRVNFNQSNESIFINLRPIYGFFVAWVREINQTNVLDNPSNKTFDYQIDEEQILTIKSQLEGVHIYRIMVEINEFLKNRPDLISNYLNYQFSLMYTTSDSLIDLKFDERYSDYLQENQRRFYRIKYNNEENQLKIIINIEGKENNDIKFWVSLQEANPYPSYPIHDFELNSQQSKILLDNDTLLKKCHKKKVCYLYIGVENTVESQYSILIIREFSTIQLQEGEIMNRPLLNKDEFYTFSYQITTNNSISIFFSSLAGSYHLYASIVCQSNSVSYPNSSKYTFFSNGSYQTFTELIISSQELRKHLSNFINNCLLFINITSIQTPLITYNKDFEILISSIVTPLQEGHPISSYLEEGIIKYFSITIHNPNIESLIISVSPIGEGDPDILVSKGKYKRPTQDSYDWKMASIKGDQLKINKNDNILKEITGTYIIGVFGFKSCEFTINALYSKSVQKIDAGIFVDVLIEEDGGYQFLEYNHYWGNMEFKLLGVIDSGDAQILINSFNNEENHEYIQSFPSNDNKMWDSKSNAHNLIYIERNNSNFCSSCLYLINVVALKVPSKISLLIEISSIYSEMQNGKIIYDFINEGKKNLYSYKTNTGLMELNIVILAGELEIYISNQPVFFGSSWVYKYSKENFTGNHLTIKLGQNFELLDYFSNDTTSEPTKFYVMVYGVKDTNFSIRFLSKSQIKILRFGVTDYSTIGPQETQFYRFSNHFVNETINILVVLFNNTINITNELKLELTYYENESPEERTVKLTSYNIHKDSILLKYQSETLAYNFKIISLNKDISLSYTLLINAKDTEIMDSGSEERLMTLNLNQAHIYELYSMQNLSFFVEVIECFGKVQLKATQTYMNTVSREYDWEFQYPYDNNHILARYDVHKGPIFLEIKSIKRDEEFNEDTLYLIRTFLVNRGEKIPQEYFYPGNSGEFEWSFNNEGVLFVDFFTIECPNGCKTRKITDFKILMIYYNFHITKDMKLLDSYGRCDLYNEKGPFYIKLYQSYEYETHPKKSQFQHYLDNNETYYINIIGEVWGYYPTSNDYQSFKIFYKQQEIINYRKNTEFQIKYLVFAGLLIILIIGIIVYWCFYIKKQRKLEKKVYELAQVKEGGEIFDLNKPDKYDKSIEYKGFHNT